MNSNPAPDYDKDRIYHTQAEADAALIDSGVMENLPSSMVQQVAKIMLERQCSAEDAAWAVGMI